MSRELWLGGAFIALALADLAFPRPGVRLLAVLAAALVVVAQGSMLREARAIPAWSVAPMPGVFLASSVVSGSAVLALVEIARGQAPGPALLATMLVVLVLGLIVWIAYVTWSAQPEFVSATAPLRDGFGAAELVGVGYVAPFVLVTLALVLPWGATALTALAAITMLAGQVAAKALLILRASRIRPIALDVTVGRRHSRQEAHP